MRLLLLFLPIFHASDKFTQTLEFESIQDASQFHSLVEDLHSIHLPLSEQHKEFIERISTTSIELNTAQTMHTGVSSAATAVIKDTHDVRTTIQHFLQTATTNSPNQADIADCVVKADQASTTALQSASALSFAIHHTYKALDETDHALEALINVTQERESVANTTLTNLYIKLTQMIHIQQEIEHIIIKQQSNIVANLPSKIIKNTVSELYQVGNTSFHENDIRTKQLLSAMRNVTLAKYYVDTLNTKMSIFQNNLLKERKEQRKLYYESTTNLVQAMEKSLTQLSIQLHLAFDGNETARDLLSDNYVPEDVLYLSETLSWHENIFKFEKIFLQQYYQVEVHEIFTLLRLAVQSERATESIEMKVIRNMQIERENEADRSTNELLNQAVLRSHVGGEKLKNWKPENENGDGTELLKEMTDLAQDDLRKGHLKRVKDYVGGKIIVEDEEGGNGGEKEGGKEEDGEEENGKDDEISLEEKEAQENAAMTQEEEKEDVTKMTAMKKKVEKERVAASNTKEEKDEVKTMHDIVESQNVEMSMQRKQREEQSIVDNNKDEYSMLKILDKQRGKVEQVASHALDIQGKATLSWENYRQEKDQGMNQINENEENVQQDGHSMNTTTSTTTSATPSTLNQTKTDAVLDQNELSGAIEKVVEQIKSSNTVEERLSTARANSLTSEVARVEEDQHMSVAAAAGKKEDDDEVLKLTKIASTEQNIVQELISERSRAIIDAEENAKEMAIDRAAVTAATGGSEPDTLLASLLVVKARYAAVMGRLVGSHKLSAHQALRASTEKRKESFQKKMSKYLPVEPMSESTKLLLKQDKVMGIAKQKFQGFFKRPFTKEEVAKELSGENEQHV